MNENKRNAIASLEKAVEQARPSIVAGLLAVGADAVLGALCNKIGTMTHDPRDGSMSSSTAVVLAIDEEVW